MNGHSASVLKWKHAGQLQLRAPCVVSAELCEKMSPIPLPRHLSTQGQVPKKSSMVLHLRAPVPSPTEFFVQRNLHYARSHLSPPPVFSGDSGPCCLT